MVDFFSNNAAAIALVLAALCLLMIVMLQAARVGRLRQRIDQLTGGVDGGDLEAVLSQHLETVHQVGRDLDEITARIAIVESSARHHFARVGLVRFNPFPDTGGNQSFALALLDESDDGFVVSSLHSRTGTRIYAKAVSGGKADTSLSAEEQDAMDEARSKRPARQAAQPRSAAATRPVAASSAAQVAVTEDAAPKPATAAGANQTPKAAPPAKAPVAAVTATAGRTPPAPTAKTTLPAPPAQSEDNVIRPTSERAKGQQKPKDLSDPEVGAAADSERVDRKPGQRPVSETGPR